MTAERDVRVHTRTLSRNENEALLAKHHVGSIAIAFHDRVTLALANYVYADGSIYGRMEDGPDLAAVRHHQWVAFQVSEIDGTYDWRTVTAHGSIHILTDEDSVAEVTEFGAALDLIRSVSPAVFTPRDPMPQRVNLFRVFVDALTGHEARTSGST
jgi:nitroimidazol reductase NimA-like FMN-containing flavoprotein (pyridoxamine 5'-phosphate oxidase superfamily)